MDGAIVVLDGGARSEQTRRGRFRFDAVRSGEHTVQLLVESLGEAAKTTGPAMLHVVLTREQLAADVTFLVSIEKRPEIRRVFPSKGGPGATRAPSPVSTGPAPGSGAGKAAEPLVSPRPHATSVPEAQQRASRAEVSAPKGAASYAVQIAAVRNGERAASLVKSLLSAGYPAYVLKPSASKGLFRIRLGPYPTREAAEDVRKRLEGERGEKGWVTRESTAR
jgi:cell division septation protein DedD